MTERQNIRLLRWVVIGVAILAAGLSEAKFSYCADGAVAPSSQPSYAELKLRYSLLQEVGLTRSKVEMFCLMHKGRKPDFVKFPLWEQFTQPTNENGEPDASGRIAALLRDVPRNPLNGLSNVAIYTHPVDISTISLGNNAGFVVVGERIFATDVSANRIFDDAAFSRFEAHEKERSTDPATLSRPGRLASLASVLVMCQKEFQLYQLQHNENLPDFARFPEWQQMTHLTDIAGSFSDTAYLGPYLPGVPHNPLTGFYRVALTTGPHKTSQQLKDEQFGFVLDPIKVKLYGVDENGKCLAARSDDPNNSGGTIRP